VSDLPDKDLPDEQQLEEYLRGGSDVSRQYGQLRSADVPAELDRLVLRQAQEAVKARPAKSRTWMRWTGPLALAASAVLVVSIVIESGVHQEAKLAAPASEPAYVPPAEVTTSASNAERDKTAVADDASDASAVHVMPLESASPVYDVLPAPFAAEAPAPASAPAPAEKRLAETRLTAPPSAEARFANERRAAKAEQPSAALADSARRQQVESVEVRAAPMPATHASVSAPVQQLQEERGGGELEEVAITGMRRPSAKPGVGPRGTIAAPAHRDEDEQADERQAEQQSNQQEQPRNYSDPEQWLRDIRELRKENKHVEADREWRRFRYVFPNYEVAEDDLARRATR
jgi:hypothetical protein